MAHSLTRASEEEAIIKIYGIVCPKTGEIRYIGKTEKTLQHRLCAHLYDSRKRHSHKQRWLAGCIDAGLLPAAQLLEEVAIGESWQDRERHWIKVAIKNGWDLTNQTAGGEGMNFIDPIAEEKYRRNLSAASKKKFHENDSLRQALIAGARRSWAENREGRIAAAMAGWTPEAKLRHAKAMAIVAKRPEFKAAKSRGGKKMWENQRTTFMKAFAQPEMKEKHSKRAKRCWSDPATRARMMSRWTPEARALQSQRIRDRQVLIQSRMTPEIRAKQAATLKETWAKRKASIT